MRQESFKKELQTEQHQNFNFNIKFTELNKTETTDI